MAKASKNKGAAAPVTTNVEATANEGAQAVDNTPAVEAASTNHAPAAAPQAEAAKPKRAPAVVQNGVPRPRAGGKCHAVWAITEDLMSETGSMPDIATVKAKAAEQELNATNVSIEYYRCRQFHGVRGRQPAAKPAEQPSAQQ